MPSKRIKDKTKLVGEWKVRTSGQKHYYHVFLWKDQESLQQNTIGNDGDDVLGCACHTPYLVLADTGEPKPNPKLGEIHFIKNRWNLEIVAHELMHVFLHKMRVFPIDRYEAMNQEGDSEEKLCLEFGQWLEDVYLALWKKNPSRKWKRMNQ